MTDVTAALTQLNYPNSFVHVKNTMGLSILKLWIPGFKNHFMMDVRMAAQHLETGTIRKLSNSATKFSSGTNAEVFDLVSKIIICTPIVIIQP